ncbi:MAG TPA: hypothetical protein VIX11_07100 [Candidatus Acidoferrum sp.]|jgi:hypothetical protein
MKPTSGGFSVRGKDKFLRAGQTANYQNIAGGLADEMMGFIRPSETRRCSPPFKMVIIDRRGTVVFKCRVSKDGRVRPVGLVSMVQDSHFPATALLTDSSLVTRTFRIEQTTPGSNNN